MMKIDKDKFKISKIKDMFKDKKGRAKLELSFYLIFFIVIILFARFSSSPNPNIKDNKVILSFINDIENNYECNMDIDINNEIYNYNIKVLGNNSRIKVKNSNEEKNYYIMNNKYYEEDDSGNYILTTSKNKYFVKILYNGRDENEANDYLERLSSVCATDISFPKLF